MWWALVRKGRSAMEDPFEGMDLVGMADGMRSGRLSPVEVAQTSLEHIARHNDRLRAFTFVAQDAALASARAMALELECGVYRGPLHGIPVAIKDNIDVVGMPTTAGGVVLDAGRRPADALVVSRLRAAGAVIVGKCNMHEYAYGVTSENPHYGSVRNAWDDGRTPGGSSGGSAVAVATGMAMASLGTDTGASVRLPAALNGVVGLRPTLGGKVPTSGVVPLAWSLDTVGPITRSVRDCAVLFHYLRGLGGSGPSSGTGSELPGGVDGLRLAYIDGLSFARLQPDVLSAVQGAVSSLESSGARCTSQDVVGLEHSLSALLTIDICEPAAVHAKGIREWPERYGEDVRTLLELGNLYSATDYIQAQRYRTFLRGQLLAILERNDAILLPTVPFVAPPIGLDHISIDGTDSEPLLAGAMRFTAMASLTGMPSISIPCGVSADGLPIGLQLIGSENREEELLSVAKVIEEHLEANGLTRAGPS